MLARALRPQMAGQAAIEYLVVLAFGVMVLMRPFSLSDSGVAGATSTQAPALQQLATAIKDYHKHYSFALAIATIPECEYVAAFDKTRDFGGIIPPLMGLDLGTLLTASASASATIDRCVAWDDPKFDVSVSGLSANLGIDPSNIAGTVTTMVSDYITGSITEFLNPASALGDLVGFDIGDIF